MSSHAIQLTNVMKTVAAADQTAAYRLFHHPRRCMVQQMFTINREVAEKFGTLTSGDATRDREMRNEWVNVLLMAPDMCEMIERGASIMFDNPAVATKLYLDLVEHLRNWLHLFETDPNVTEAPINDLRQFDELAALIFPYAAPSLMKHEDDAGYGAFMAKLRRGGRVTLDWRNRGQAADPTLPKPTQKYRPLSDAIADWMYRRRRS